MSTPLLLMYFINLTQIPIDDPPNDWDGQSLIAWLPLIDSGYTSLAPKEREPSVLIPRLPMTTGHTLNVLVLLALLSSTNRGAVGSPAG